MVEIFLQSGLNEFSLLVEQITFCSHNQFVFSLQFFQNIFHHIEIVSEKNEHEYQKLIKHLDIQPSEFLMIGNSLKSDIIPVLNIGGHAFHVPFYTTWEFEKVDKNIDHPNFKELENVKELLKYLETN